MSTRLKPIRFKDYTWPHNPTYFNMEFKKNVVEHEYPDIHGTESEDFGNSTRVVTGSGEFFGEGAYRDFSALVLLFADKTPGLFIHPKWAPFQARFTKLSSREEPRPDYVAYDFEFIEYKDINHIVRIRENQQSSNETPQQEQQASIPSTTYVVKRGDTLWDIAKRHYGNGSEWPKIADANKNLIKNPNLIYPGWKLTIP